MSKLPVVKASKLEKILQYLGFVYQRQKESHAFYRHPDRRYTTPGKDLPRELIRTILKQINLSTDEFLELLNKV
jgi:predicted RNA binding protein YcfA (HicA-like mRNA interferase family)